MVNENTFYCKIPKKKKIKEKLIIIIIVSIGKQTDSLITLHTIKNTMAN